MKKWTDDFLARCLDGLPKDKYRKRTESELTDHLLELCADLESGGYSPEEAQARALELMGDPEELNPSFREEWVRRASNWKYCLSALLKAAIHAMAANIFARWILLYPILVFGHGILFDGLESGHPLSVTLFTLVNFLPGLWFCARELHERFFLHPRRTVLVCLGFLTLWVLDISPWIYPMLPNHILLTPFNIFALFFIIPTFLGQLPLELLAMDNSPAAVWYLILSFTLCLFFARFYRPKHNRPFMLSDKT